MRIPFNSLCPVDWLVWSDWSRDQGRERAANWGQKVGKALEKFSSSGGELRMALVTRTRRHRNRDGRFRECVLDENVVGLVENGLGWFLEVGYKLHYSSDPQLADFTWGKWHWRGSRWVRSHFPRDKGILLFTPTDLVDPWKWWKLSQKFFQCVVSRARGIREAVTGDLK